MANELVVPPLGESITEAVIGQWLKQVGDLVEADEPVVDLETDKVTVQLSSPVAGVLIEQRFAKGDAVQIGEVVGRVDPDATPAVLPVAAVAMASKAAAPAGKPAASAPPDAKGSTQGAGSAARAEPAPPAAVGGAARQGAPQPAVAPAAAAPSATPTLGATQEHSAGPALDEVALRRLSPAQRRSVRRGEHSPVREAPAAAPAAPAPARAAAPAAPAAAAAPAARAVPGAAAASTEHEEVVPMSPLRKRIAQRLVQVQQETASLTTFNEVDMSGVMDLRRRHNEAFQAAHGIKLGFMSLFAKACVAACKRFPGLNAEVRDDAIVYKKHYDFGIAVSTERGLVVPVLRGVDELSLAEIEQSIVELANKARQNKLTLDDLVGGTFTITNGGIFGSMLSTPLLNYPQTGILGMHNIVNRPVAVGDRVEVRPVMYIALTYDHRVVDGREAVQFLVAVKERIESPERLLLDL